jgi:hypothetical protein
VSAARVSSECDDVGSCELRFRFGKVEESEERALAISVELAGGGDIGKRQRERAPVPMIVLKCNKERERFIRIFSNLMRMMGVCS